MDCPDDNTLAALFDHSIGSATLAALDSHLDECERCRSVVALALGSNEVAKGTPSALAELDRDPEGLLGSTVGGRYEVASLLGRGGMGTVYLARDVTLDRDVALKIHRAGVGDLRLKREAVAMAQLAHPNVVNVFEVGTIETTTYVAMEYVRGSTLRAWVASTRRPWRDVVDLLIDAGRGLSAAHAAGLVHRDFKPENVLVGKDGRPRVSDFGLVRVERAVESATPPSSSIETTMVGTVMGTPAYMAPEQFAGADVDARCDQFAFCVVAWECFYGRRPFDGSTVAEVRDAVERHAVQRPPRSAVPDRVRRVLERGLAAAPDDRYADIGALLADLRRAAAPRFKRRAGLALALVIVASGTAWARGHSESDPCSAPSLWDPPQRLRVEASFLATGLPYALDMWGRTQNLLDQFADKWRLQHREACLAYEVHHTDDTALHARRETCLEQSKIAFDATLDRLGEVSTAAKIEHAKTADRSLALQATQLVDQMPDVDACVRPDNFELPVEPASRAKYVAFLTEVARIESLLSAGRVDDAAREVDTAKQMAKELGSKRAEARISYMTGSFAEMRHHNDDAVKAYESALYTAEAVGYDDLVALSAVEVLHALGAAARTDDAERYRELARAAAERTGSSLARAHAARAIGYADVIAGRFDAAEHEYTTALELVRSRIPNDDYEVAAVLTDLGDLYYRRGQSAKSEPLQREAIMRFARAAGPDHPAQGTAYDNLGNTLADLGKYDEAAAAYARALAIRVRALGPDDPEVAQTLNNGAGLAMQAGNFDLARRQLERALAIYDKTIPPTHPLATSVWFNLGEVARLQGKVADAVRFHSRALELRRQKLGDHAPTVTATYLALAEDAFAQHDLVAAASSCGLARSSYTDPKNTELGAGIEACSGTLALDAGQPARAVPLLEHALELHRAGESDPGELAAIELALARALPASAAPRALELARAARAGFAHEGAFRRRELALADAWLRDHATK